MKWAMAIWCGTLMLGMIAIVVLSHVLPPAKSSPGMLVALPAGLPRNHLVQTGSLAVPDGYTREEIGKELPRDTPVWLAPSTLAAVPALDARRKDGVLLAAEIAPEAVRAGVVNAGKEVLLCLGTENTGSKYVVETVICPRGGSCVAIVLVKFAALARLATGSEARLLSARPAAGACG